LLRFGAQIAPISFSIGNLLELYEFKAAQVNSAAFLGGYDCNLSEPKGTTPRSPVLSEGLIEG